ncbi:MAG: HupE/UreJ family protein, partial [Geminicoccaceae bacterium]
GSGQTLRVSQSAPSVVIPMTPSPLDVALSYTRLGFEHILEGLDHLLFVAGLLLLVDGAGRLIKTITAFTLAHSITLALATFGYLSLPPKPVEAVIALSIVFLAVEVIKAQRGERSLMRQAPWLIAFVFGLLHGLGFAGALGDIGLPQGDVPLALVAFNIGVELGQLAFVALFLITVALARRLAVSPGRRATTVGAYGVGAIAGSWFIDRLLGLIA